MTLDLFFSKPNDYFGQNAKPNAQFAKVFKVRRTLLTKYELNQLLSFYKTVQ